MKLGDIINFRDKLSENLKKLIPGNIVILLYTNNGLLSVGTLDNHNSIYNSYNIVSYDEACEGFLYIEECGS